MEGLNRFGKGPDRLARESPILKAHEEYILEQEKIKTIKSEISESFSNDKDTGIEAKDEDSSIMSVTQNGQKLAQIIFNDKKILVKKEGKLKNKRFEYNENARTLIVDYLKSKIK